MNFQSLAFNPAGRSNEIVRYSSVHQEQEETLAEHITDVSMMSYFIAKSIEKVSEGREVINIGSLLEKCLLHDLDEVLTGDITRNTKYATKRVHSELDKVAQSAVDMISSITDINLTDAWKSAKQGKEGLIVKIVDMLVVVKKAIIEIELRHNFTFLKVVSELSSHISRLIDHIKIKNSDFTEVESKEYLINLLTQARAEITTIKVKYGHIIDKYLIYENVIEGED